MRVETSQNKRLEERVVCSDTEIISLVHKDSDADSVSAIIHDKSKSGLGVFYFSNGHHPSKSEFKTEDGISYELRWSMKIYQNVQYFGLKLLLG